MCTEMKHLLLLPALLALLPAQQPLRVCATTPDLASLVASIGGPLVEVTTFTKGVEDPHFLDARPSMIRALHDADLLVDVGLDLEVGWLPVLTGQARNGNVLRGGAGRLVAGDGIQTLGVPSGIVDRALGDVHAYGNPHYLLDPVRGLQVAGQIRDALSRLRPEARDAFGKRYDELRERIAGALVGEQLAGTYDVEKLALLQQHGRLQSFLTEQGQLDQLGGWLGALRPYAGAKLVADHDLWPYFAARFGLEVIGFFEPKPGIAPTTGHLEELTRRMQAEQVRVILSVPYFSARHAEFVARKTGARIAAMAHQTGARPGATDYVAMIDHNVRAIVAALGQAQ